MNPNATHRQDRQGGKKGGREEGGTPQMGCHLDKAMISPIVIFGSQQAPKWLQVGSKLAPRGRSNWVIQTPEFDVNTGPNEADQKYQNWVSECHSKTNSSQDGASVLNKLLYACTH